MIVGDSLDTQTRDCSNTGDVFFAGNSVTVYMILICFQSGFSFVFFTFHCLSLLLGSFRSLLVQFQSLPVYFRSLRVYFRSLPVYFRFTSGLLPVHFRCDVISTSGVTSYLLPARVRCMLCM